MTEMWPMIIEKALAKHLGSYALLLTQNADVVNLISYLLGGLSTVEPLKPLAMDDDDDDDDDEDSEEGSDSDGNASEESSASSLRPRRKTKC